MADVNINNPNVVTTPEPNATSFAVASTTIVTAGTPVQLSALAVPDGRGLIITSDLTNTANRVVYVATSSANALDATKRITLAPGGSVKLFVTDASVVWVNANANAQKVIAIVEQ